MTQEELQNYLEVLRGRESGEIFDLRWDELRNAGSNLSEGRWDRLSAVGLFQKQIRVSGTKMITKKPGKAICLEVLHYWKTTVIRCL